MKLKPSAALETVKLCCRALDEKKAGELKVLNLDVREDRLHSRQTSARIDTVALGDAALLHRLERQALTAGKQPLHF